MKEHIHETKCILQRRGAVFIDSPVSKADMVTLKNGHGAEKVN